MIRIEEIVGLSDAERVPQLQEFVDRAARVLFRFVLDSVRANVEIDGDIARVVYFQEEGDPLAEIHATFAEGKWSVFSTNLDPGGCKSCYGGSCSVPSTAWSED